ncbi:MAG: CARDB domain-containing protein [Candidatus Eisenbacteria bacterium]
MEQGKEGEGIARSGYGIVVRTSLAALIALFPQGPLVFAQITDATTREFTVFNNVLDHPPIDDVVSREFTIYNDLQAIPEFDDAVAREFTVFNNLFAEVALGDGFTRSSSVFNNRVVPDGGDCANDEIAFVWDSVTTAVGYRLDVAAGPSEASIIDQFVMGDTLAYTYPVGLPEGSHYYARIAATPDGGGHYFPGPFSPGIVVDETFPTANAPTGRLHDDGEVRFEFSGTDNQYVAGFHVQVAIDIGFTTIILDTSVTVPHGLSLTGQPGETHFAKAAAIDCAGNEGPFGGRSNGVIVAPLPDLAVTQVSAPDSAFSGQTIQVSWQVSNLGPGGTNTPSWEDAVYLSTDTLLDVGEDISLGRHGNVSYLQAGESYTNVQDGELPEGIAGTYYVIVVTDVDEEMAESTSENNVAVSDPLEVTLALYPNLQVVSVSRSPEIAFTGDPVNVGWTVENTGPGMTGAEEWYDAVFHSEDSLFNFVLTYGGDIRVLDKNLGRFKHRGALGPGESYDTSATVVIPIDGLAFTLVGRAETGYFFVFTDHGGTAVIPHYDERGDVYEYVEEFDNWTRADLEVVLRPPPDLVVENITLPSSGSSGDTLQFSWTVKNTGIGPTYEDWWHDRYSMSLDTAYDHDTEYLHGGHTHYGVLEVDSSYTVTKKVYLPPQTEGEYYLFAETDWYENVYEHAADTNNVSRSAGTVSVDLSPWPDLRVYNAPVGGSYQAGARIAVSWTVGNDGFGSIGNRTWKDGVYISESAVFGDPSQVRLATAGKSGPLDTMATYDRTAQITVPPGIAGPHYFHVETDVEDDVFEHTDEGNNVFTSAAVEILPYPPVDLAVSNLVLPGTIGVGDSLLIGWTVTNIGDAATLVDQWIDHAYLSSDVTLEPGTDFHLKGKRHEGVLGAGESYSRSFSVELPDNLIGDYYLIVEVDSADAVGDADPENNVAASASPVTIEIVPTPDLSVTGLSAPAEGVAGQPILISWTAQNLGEPVSSSKSWYDAVYLSLDAYIDNYDDLLGTVKRTGGLGTSESYDDTLVAELPIYVSGGYHLILEVDNERDVYEGTSEANNSDVLPFTALLPAPADLVVSAVNPPGAAVPGDSAFVSWTVSNQGTNPADGIVRDGIYISTDPLFDVEDPLLGVFEDEIHIAPGTSIRKTHKVGLEKTYRMRADGSLEEVLPGVTPGDYYFIAKTDIRNNIRETNDNNNWTAADTVTDVSVNMLMLGTPATEQFREGQMRYFGIDVGAGFDLKVSLESDTSGAGNEIYVAYDRMPTLNDHDYVSREPFTANHILTVPSTEAGTYYIMVMARHLPRFVFLEDCTLLVEALSLSITSITPDAGGNAGKVTCQLSGAGFRDSMTVWLAQDDSLLYQAEMIEFQSTMDAKIRWDLTGVRLGAYDVAVDLPNIGTVYLPMGFNVELAQPLDVQITENVPQYLRAGRHNMAGFSFTNSGNTDIPYLLAFGSLPSSADISVTTSAGFLKLSDLVIDGQEISNPDYLLSAFSESLTITVPLIIRNVPPGETVEAQFGIDNYWTSLFGFSVSATALTPVEYLTFLVEQIENGRQVLLDQDAYDIPIHVLPLIVDEVEFRDYVLSIYVAVGLLDEPAVSGLLKNGWNCSSIHTVARVGGGFWELCPGATPGPNATCDEVEEFCEDCAQIVCAAITLLWCLPVGEVPICSFTTGLLCYADFRKFCLQNINACDPNEILGPSSFGDENWVGVDRTLPYSINYENDPELATAPAQIVDIRQQLDPDLDPATFRLSSFGFGNFTFQPPENVAFFSERLDLRDSLGLFVDITAGIDVQENEVFWHLKSIDPATGELPTDPFAGFLPVNDTLIGNGQGFVNYSIRPRADAVTGDVIDAEASIVFDVNAPVATPAIFHTIDADKPASHVDSLPPIIEDTEFSIPWTASDATPGSGFESIALYVSDNDGYFQSYSMDYMDDPGDGPIIFNGERGHTYGFFTIATDHAGNVEAMKTVAEQTVTIGTEVTVWPGDCNANGTANQNDLLPIGLYFGTTGPVRPNGNLTWVGQPALAWETDAATHADADGDGVVDQNDILAIGLNFGETHAFAKDEEAGAQPEVFASVVIPPLPVGTRFPVEIALDSTEGETTDLFGIGLALDLPGRFLAIDTIQLSETLDDGRLLRYNRWDEEGSRLAAAYTRTRGRPGAGKMEPGAPILTVWMEVVGVMPGDAEIVLEEVEISSSTRLLPSPEMTLSSPVAVPTPTRFVLDGNRPNPFNPVTLVRFGVPRRSAVSFDIYNVAGRHVKNLVDEEVYPAGWHTITLDGKGMASGVYFCRMKAGDFKETRKMILIR